jgi:CHAT domain-containing protein/Tfp pilus assembly protein PilF
MFKLSTLIFPIIGIILFSFLLCFVEVRSQEMRANQSKELAQALINAKTDQERKALLVEKRSLLTKELFDELSARAKELYVNGNNLQALSVSKLIMELAEQIDDSQVELRLGTIAAALNRIGLIYQIQSNYSEALEYYQRGLVIAKELNDKQKIAAFIGNIGNLYDSLGDKAKALENYNKSLSIFEELGDRIGIGKTLNNIGKIYSEEGKEEKAFEYFNKYLNINRELNNKEGISIALNNMASFYEMRGNYAQALEYYQKSLNIEEEFGDRDSIAIELNNLGILYRKLGNYTHSLELHKRALKLEEEIGNKQVIPIILNCIGTIYTIQDNHTQALGYYQKALKIYEEIDNKHGVAISLERIGFTLNKQGNYAEALKYSKDSLKLAEENGQIKTIIYSLIGLGQLYLKQADYLQAEECIRRAISYSREIGFYDSLREALSISGKVHLALNQPLKAEEDFEETIKIIERLRTNIASTEQRATYLASMYETYQEYIDLKLRLHKENSSKGHDAVALHICERLRARSLLDSLEEAHINIHEGISPKLLQQEQEIRQRLNTVANKQDQLLRGTYNKEQADIIAKDIDKLILDYESIKAKIRYENPRYATLTYPEPLKASEIQELLDPDTVLLEYLLGDKQSYLWAVTPKSIHTYILPKRTEIEDAAKQVYELLTARSLRLANESVSQRNIRIAEADSKYPDAATKLSQMILGPAASQLTTKRLVVIADGMLLYIPFSALANPLITKSTNSDWRPIGATHEVVSCPSASVLKFQRSEIQRDRKHSLSLAIFADPVYEREDPRVKVALSKQKTRKVRNEVVGSSQVETENKVNKNITKIDLIDRSTIHRLPFSRLEAEEIYKLAGNTRGWKVTDFEANHSTVINKEISNYQIVHFATHGLLNDNHPELSGLVLSLIDHQGKEVDGFLRVNEIYNLKIPADLVVLSACQTALGKEVRGEGIVGLVRSFMYAGSKRVVASLWKVDDEATAKLMSLFYKGILKEGRRPSEALRFAREEIRKERRWRAPFYWAAFDIQGEWN